MAVSDFIHQSQFVTFADKVSSELKSQKKKKKRNEYDYGSNLINPSPFIDNDSLNVESFQNNAWFGYSDSDDDGEPNKLFNNRNNKNREMMSKAHPSELRTMGYKKVSNIISQPISYEKVDNKNIQGSDQLYTSFEIDSNEDCIVRKSDIPSKEKKNVFKENDTLFEEKYHQILKDYTKALNDLDGLKTKLYQQEKDLKLEHEMIQSSLKTNYEEKIKFIQEQCENDLIKEKENLTQHYSVVEEYANKLKEKNSELSHTKSQMIANEKRLEEEKTSLKALNESLSKRISELNEQVVAALNTVSQFSEKNSHQTKECDQLRLTSELQKRQINDLISQNSDYKEDIKRYNSMLVDNQNKLSENEQLIKQKDNLLTTTQCNLTNCESEIGKLMTKVKYLEDYNKSQEHKINELQESYTMIASEYDLVKKENLEYCEFARLSWVETDSLRKENYLLRTRLEQQENSLKHFKETSVRYFSKKNGPDNEKRQNVCDFFGHQNNSYYPLGPTRPEIRLYNKATLKPSKDDFCPDGRDIESSQELSNYHSTVMQPNIKLNHPYCESFVDNQLVNLPNHAMKWIDLNTKSIIQQQTEKLNSKGCGGYLQKASPSMSLNEFISTCSNTTQISSDDSIELKHTDGRNREFLLECADVVNNHDYVWTGSHNIPKYDSVIEVDTSKEKDNDITDFSLIHANPNNEKDIENKNSLENEIKSSLNICNNLFQTMNNKITQNHFSSSCNLNAEKKNTDISNNNLVLNYGASVTDVTNISETSCQSTSTSPTDKKKKNRYIKLVKSSSGSNDIVNKVNQKHYEYPKESGNVVGNDKSLADNNKLLFRRCTDANNTSDNELHETSSESRDIDLALDNFSYKSTEEEKCIPKNEYICDFSDEKIKYHKAIVLSEMKDSSLDYSNDRPIHTFYSSSQLEDLIKISSDFEKSIDQSNNKHFNHLEKNLGKHSIPLQPKSNIDNVSLLGINTKNNEFTIKHDISDVMGSNEMYERMQSREKIDVMKSNEKYEPTQSRVKSDVMKSNEKYEPTQSKEKSDVMRSNDTNGIGNIISRTNDANKLTIHPDVNAPESHMLLSVMNKEHKPIFNEADSVENLDLPEKFDQSICTNINSCHTNFNTNTDPLVKADPIQNFKKVEIKTAQSKKCKSNSISGTSYNSFGYTTHGLLSYQFYSKINDKKINDFSIDEKYVTKNTSKTEKHDSSNQENGSPTRITKPLVQSYCVKESYTDKDQQAYFSEVIYLMKEKSPSGKCRYRLKNQ